MVWLFENVHPVILAGVYLLAGSAIAIAAYVRSSIRSWRYGTKDEEDETYWWLTVVFLWPLFVFFGSMVLLVVHAGRFVKDLTRDYIIRKRRAFFAMETERQRKEQEMLEVMKELNKELEQ